MLDIQITGEAFSSSILSKLPSSDVSDDLHVILSANERIKIDSSLWNQLFDDQRLRILSLIDLQLYQNDAALLGKHLANNTTLIELTLQSVRQSVYAFDEILNQGLQKNTSIKRLTLSNLENVDASTVASLIKYNQSIESLTLTHNHISSTGATLIADAIRSNKNLLSFDLSHNDLDDLGALALIDSLEKSSNKLKEIHLNDNRITEETRMKIESSSSKPRRIVFASEAEPILPMTIEQSTTNSKPKEKSFLLAMILVTFLFFLWGVPNQLNDVLIRQFSKAFVLSRFEAGLVQSAFYLGYFLWSLPAAYVLRRWGYKIGLIIGLLLFGSGSFMFWPAALIGSYTPFLLSLFVIATGLAFLETAANPFIAHAVGPVETSEKRLNIAQAFNPLGAITGALVGTLFIFSGIELTDQQIEQLKRNHTYEDYLTHETLRVVRPYVVLGIITFVWALFIGLVPFPHHSSRDDDQENDQHSDGSNNLCRPLFIFAIVAQFAYVGAQVGTWSYFMQYAQDYVSVTEKIGGYLLTGTLGMFAIGRLSAALLMHFGLSPSILLATFSMVNVLLIVVTVLVPNVVGLSTLFCTSFFMSLMFPTIFALGIKGFSGHTTKLASCLLVMSIIGGAVFTPLMGLIAEKTQSLALAYTLPGGAYLLIALYALLAYVLMTRQQTNNK